MLRTPLLLLLVPVLQLVSSQYEECYPNEVLTHTVNPCNTCEIRGSCPQEEPGCDCAPGLLRSSDGNCVPPDACYQSAIGGRTYGQPQPPPYGRPLPVRCQGPFEEFLSCGSACPPACEKRTRPCPLQCVASCFCVDGYVRNEQRHCVRSDQCHEIPEHPVPVKPARCGPNEEFTDCGTPCPPTCQDRSPLCGLQCVPGCFCRRGFLRYNGRCVPPPQCPTPRPAPQPTCGPNEVYSGCGSACPPTCTDRRPVCTSQCIRGCFCRPGFVKNGGLCVPPQACDPYKGAQPPRPPVPPLLDCPDRRKCIAYCKRSGSATGFCVGESYKNCVCR